jgi:hypothetical protein
MRAKTTFPGIYARVTGELDVSVGKYGGGGRKVARLRAGKPDSI